MAGNEQAIKKVEKRIDALEKVIKTLPNLIVKKDEIRWSKHEAKIAQAFDRVAGDSVNLVRAIKKVQDDVIKNKTYNTDIVEKALTSIIEEF